MKRDLGDISIPDRRKLIDSWVYSERDRRILHRRLCDGVKYEDLEAETGLTTRRLKDIVYQYIDYLKNKEPG